MDKWEGIMKKSCLVLVFLFIPALVVASESISQSTSTHVLPDADFKTNSTNTSVINPTEIKWEEIDKAEEHFQNALSADSFDDSIKEITRAILLKPDRAKYYSFRGDKYYLKRSLDDFKKDKKLSLKALNDYNACLKLSQNDLDTNLDCSMAKGEILCNIGRYKEGIAELSNSINKIHDQHLNTYVQARFYELRALCYQETKQFNKAITDISKAINLKKDNNFYTLISRAAMYQHMNLLNESLRDLQAACKMCKNIKGCKEYPCLSAFNLKRTINRGDKYQYIGSVEDYDWYYDKQSIVQKKHQNLKVWLRLEPITQLNSGGILLDENYSYKLLLWHIDCLNRELAAESSVEYDTNGKLVKNYHFDPSSSYTKATVVPDSMGDVVANHLCKVRRSKH